MEQVEEPTLRDGPVVTPRPLARSTGRYSRRSTEGSLLSSIRSSFEPPAPSGAVRAASCDFLPKSEGDTTRETVGPASHCDPVAWCSRTRTLRARTAEAWCPRTGTLQAQIPNTAPDEMAPSAFDPFLEYSTDNVVLCWRPPSYISQWSPSSFVVDGVSCSCAKQFIMAEKARLFKDHRAVNLIMSSPDPSTHKRIGRGVRNFDSASWDREKQNAVLFLAITPNPRRTPP